MKKGSFKSFLRRNSSNIYTALGLLSFGVTLYFTIKKTPKAHERLKEAKEELEDVKNSDGENQEEARKVVIDAAKDIGKIYLPAISTCTFSMFSIIMSNRISAKKEVALSMAYSATKNFLKDYRDSTIKRIGENEERKIREDVAERQKTRVCNNIHIMTAEGDYVVYDSVTNTKFISSANKIIKTVNDLNYRLMQEHYITLADLYYELGAGVKTPKAADVLGWSIDDGLIDIYFTYDGDPETGQPYAILNYSIEPRDVEKMDIYGR